MLDLACALHLPALPHLVVYQDDEDPQRYHVVSTKARLAGRDGVPSFSLVSAGSAGPAFLSLTTELGANADDESVLRTTLADPNFVSGRLRPANPAGGDEGYGSRPIAVAAMPAGAGASVVAPMFTDGQAVLVIGNPQAKLVETTQRPSLFGSNNASFSLMLDQGAATLEELAAGSGSVGALTYTLTFPARVPAVSLTLEARGSGPQAAETIEAAIERGALVLTASDRDGNPVSSAMKPVVLDLAAELWRLRAPEARTISVVPGEIVTCHHVATTTLRELVPRELWKGVR